MSGSKRYAIVQNDKITGVVNWNGAEAHPYGAVVLRGPLPEDVTLEQLLGKSWGDIAKPRTAEEAIAGLREDGDADPEGTARLNHPHLFEPSNSAEENGFPMTAGRLIEAAPQMRWFAFKAEAKRILGEDMPEKKPDIVEALRKITKSD